MSGEERERGALAALYKMLDESLDNYLMDLTGQTVRYLEGQPLPLDPGGLHGTLLEYWERTGQKDKIFSSYTREQVVTAVLWVWASQFVFWANEYARDEVEYPARQRDNARLDLLDKNIADQTERNRAQAAKDYGDIRAIYAQLIQESPELAKKANGKARNAVISKKLGKAISPALIKQIQRALRGVK
jgi:hypothetical protein